MGFRASRTSRKEIQRDARAVVEEFMLDVHRYVAIDFSDARLDRTRKRLQDAIAKASGVSAEAFIDASATDDPTIIWLIETITLDNVRKHIDEISFIHDLGISERAWSIVVDVSEATLKADVSIDLEAIFLSSTNDWDMYLRSLAPDQPTWITDWLLARSFTASRFQVFWSTLTEQLSPEEVGKILNWYNLQVSAAGADSLESGLPTWMR
jgi:hypothetical protein